jgi:DNA-binding IclR family transcriptional regulator
MSERSTSARADKSPVAKALKLLTYIAQSKHPVALAELSRQLDYPKPTSYRLARFLERLGYVQRDPLTRRYLIDAAFDDIALSALKHGAGQRSRRLLMNELAHRIGARVNLVVLKSGGALFVEWVETITTPLRIDFDPDIPLPVHCTASGKLLLAFGASELRKSVLRSGPYKARTANTITTAAMLKRELELIRTQGHAEDDEELFAGVNCVAVPVHNRAGDVVAGLAVMAPVAHLPLESMRRLLPTLHATADLISRDISQQPKAVPGPAAVSMPAPFRNSAGTVATPHEKLPQSRARHDGRDSKPRRKSELRQ